MKDIKHISSLQNPLVKQTILLKEKSRERKKTGLFVLEGKKELEIATRAGYSMDTILVCKDFIDEEAFHRFSIIPNNSFVSVSSVVYKKLAHRDTTEGVIAIAQAKNHDLSAINIENKNPLILVAEAPEKPGNIGALLRTADAANLDAVFIANPKTDLYNPNIIRSSVGCVFSGNIILSDTSSIIAFLKERDINIFCAALTASKRYTTVAYTKPTAIIVGTEHSGLSEEWLSSSSQNIIIPMEGKIDSMNVSVSAAILIFEAKRQRHIS
ncbi:TrmH family RNA methyltransferase [Maribacter sp. PR1]|uniref:TrmH family RNA methyltransferase n=1 Tax=Maribacter cobaltidurans TaxID=1178778 RepID=A0ABU7IXD7_9FLAO|nr:MULTISPECIES: TrmH family RNA methyltransferase [Maribacter]MDC6389863.1 TrmH family RNA methyltransferase [Maribacter sp. PR1]MEE1977253.1 TrmH family RNA methyltransferase [Maribacter cobaltidurans]